MKIKKIKIFLIITTLFITCCVNHGPSPRERMINNIKFNEDLKIDHGFFSGCTANVQRRENYYGFIASVECPQQPNVTLINVELDGRSFFKEYREE